MSAEHVLVTLTITDPPADVVGPMFDLYSAAMAAGLQASLSSVPYGEGTG